MKSFFGILAVLLLVGCASTWVDPRLNLRGTRIGVQCVDDPLGLAARIENLLRDASIETSPLGAKNAGDLVLRVTYKFKKSDSGVNSIQSVKAEMLDPRYHSQEGRYEWNGDGDTQDEAAQKLVDALTARQ